MIPHESDLLRKLRLIEILKADVVMNVGFLFQGIARNAQAGISEGIAGIIVSCYILAKRLGVDFAEVDESIKNKINQNINLETDAEKWFGDYSQLKRHLQNKE